MLTPLPPAPVGANDRVFQLMDRKPHVPVKGGPAPRPVEGLVEFNDVHFSYEGSLHTALAVHRSLPLLLSPPLSYPTRADQAVLRGTTFSIKPGQVAALVGPSGGGKAVSPCAPLTSSDVCSLFPLSYRQVDSREPH